MAWYTVPISALSNPDIFRNLLNTILALLAGQAGGGTPVPTPGGGTIDPDAPPVIYTNTGATSIAPFALPPAALGLRCGFLVTDADGIRVTAATGDTIQVSSAVSAAAGKAESTATGSFLYLMAVDDTQWFATSVEGTWTVT